MAQSSAVQQLEARLKSEFAATINELRSEIGALQLELQQSQSQRQRVPRPRLPDPDKFTGQTFKLDTWHPSIKVKLRVDGLAIGDSTAQFYYVFLNLDSTVQAMVLSQLAYAENTGSWNYNTILTQLARVYNNPNKVQEAEDKLHRLTQGTDSITTFIAKFERVLFEAGAQNWPDVNKISIFRNELNPTVRNRLSQQLNLPRVYDEFIKVVQLLSGRVSAAVSSVSISAVSSTSSGSKATAPRLYDPMDTSIGEIQLNNISSICRPTSPQAIRHPQHPTWFSVNNIARSTSPEQREQYRVHGKCVRCGSERHWVFALY